MMPKMLLMAFSMILLLNVLIQKATSITYWIIMSIVMSVISLLIIILLHFKIIEEMLRVIWYCIGGIKLYCGEKISRISCLRKIIHKKTKNLYSSLLIFDRFAKI